MPTESEGRFESEKEVTEREDSSSVFKRYSKGATLVEH